MTAVLRARVDVQNQSALLELQKGIEQTAGASDEMSVAAADLRKRMAEVADQERQNVTIINEHRASVSQLAATSITAFGSIATEGLHYARVLAEIGLASEALRRGTALAAEGAVTSSKAWQTLAGVTERLGINLAVRGIGAWAGYGAAVGTAATTVGVALLALKGLELALENTGETINGKFVSNWDKLTSGVAGFGSDVKTVAVAGVTALKEKIVEWATETEQAAEKAVKSSDAYRNFSDSANAATSFMLAKLTDFREFVTGLPSDIAESNARLDDFNKRTAESFENVRLANTYVEARIKSRAEAARIASIETTGAIDLEIHKLQELRQQLATTGKFDEEQGKAYVDQIDALEKRRTQIQDDEAKKRSDAEKKASDERKKQFQDDLNAIARARDKETDDIVAHNKRVEAEAEKAEKARFDAAKKVWQEEIAFRYQVGQQISALEQKQQQESLSKMKAVLEQAKQIVTGQKGDGGNQIDQIKAGVAPNINAQIIKNRGLAAKNAFAAADNDSPDAATRAARANAAGRAAERQARQDIAHGKVSDQEKLDAENQLVNQTINEAAQQGKLNQQTIAALKLGYQEANKATQEAINAQQMVKALQEQFTQAQGATRNRQGVTNGSLRR